MRCPAHRTQNVSVWKPVELPPHFRDGSEGHQGGEDGLSGEFAGEGESESEVQLVSKFEMQAKA